MRRFIALSVLVFSAFGPGQRAGAASPEMVTGEHGMVVTAQHLASQVGADILRQGGNAVDAAVAVGYALAVVYPQAGNIGGGGFMTIRFADGRSTFLDFREKAPLAATSTMYQDGQGNVDGALKVKGYLAVGVPGTVKGLDLALQRYGTMARAMVMAPAIRLAADGFELTDGDAAFFAKVTPSLTDDGPAAAIFLKNGKDVLAAGDHLVQTDLAASLRKIADTGADAFYRGRSPRRSSRRAIVGAVF